MWWYFEKIAETENEILYIYGYESREMTGEFTYDKKNLKANIIKFADNHSNEESIQYPAYQLVTDYSHLDRKMIAYG